jgi:hypothetical protein
LGDHFKCPTWWRKAKIGMWLHWRPHRTAQGPLRRAEAEHRHRRNRVLKSEAYRSTS